MAQEREDLKLPQALHDACVANFGTYTLDAGNGVIARHVEADLAEIHIGSDELRPCVLRGATLILAPHWQVDGHDRANVRVFKRAVP